jgi:hypothetical protein
MGFTLGLNNFFNIDQMKQTDRQGGLIPTSVSSGCFSNCQAQASRLLRLNRLWQARNESMMLEWF